MESLFSKAGLAALKALTRSSTLYAFDFDGTLSQIAQRPSDAKFAKSTEGLIERLSEAAMVAIISGRSLVDLMARFSMGRVHLVGNHGIEGAGSNALLVDAEQACLRWMDQLSGCSWPHGIEIENKAFSISIHYRACSDLNETKTEILKIASRLKPMARVLDGKAVINILPVNAPHKGNAIQEIAKRLGARNVLFIGDDFTDEDAFQALLPNEHAVTIKVGEDKNSKAKFFIREQQEIDQLLEILLKQCEVKKSRAKNRGVRGRAQQ